MTQNAMTTFWPMAVYQKPRVHFMTHGFYQIPLPILHVLTIFLPEYGICQFHLTFECGKLSIALPVQIV